MNNQGVSYPGSVGEELGMAMGGLGTSTLEIGRDGSFQNICLQNDWGGRVKPTPTATFLSVHAQTADGQGSGRLLQLEAPEGLPSVAGLTYTGRFPFTDIDYADDGLPCRVRLEAFSPFVPLDAASSSLPLVFFRFRLKNTTDKKLSASAAISWVNNIAAETHDRGGWPAAGNVNTLRQDDGAPSVLMTTRVEGITGSEYLLSGIAGEGVDFSAVADWWKGAPGRWMGPNFKQPESGAVKEWTRFLDQGILPEESGYDDQLGRFSYHQPAAAVAGRVELQPGEEKAVWFALSWFFPYHYDRQVTRAKLFLGHQYAARFPGGTREVFDWALARRDVLYEKSGAWRRLIEESSLPPKLRALMTETLYLLPRISWWLADGRFVVYEAINCPRVQATILDVYVAPVLAAVFPDLHAQALRTTAAAQLPTGEIPSTLGSNSVHHHEYRVFSPGDVSVFPITTAWEVLWGGDRQFLEDMYPVMKQVLKWGKAALDEDNDGVPDCHGIDQGWDTFPMQGAAAYIADQWLGGLLAGEHMARYVGDADFEAWCRDVREQAAHTAEHLLWNGKYYDLFHDTVTGEKSAVSFADQFTYGELATAILEFGHTHPQDRIKTTLESLWRLNVETCRYGARMGSLPDGSPADSSVHKEQKGGASQSNAFTPVSTAPLAAVAIQNGMVDKGLELAEQMAESIIDIIKEPWSGKLLFNSETSECFYGLHYSDCMIVWNLMHVLIGVHMNALDRSLKLAPPRVPVKVPVFSKLYCGQVEFAVLEQSVTLRLSHAMDRPCLLKTLTVELPADVSVEGATVREGKAGAVRQDGEKRTVLEDVVIGPEGTLVVAWSRPA